MKFHRSLIASFSVFLCLTVLTSEIGFCSIPYEMPTNSEYRLPQKKDIPLQLASAAPSTFYPEVVLMAENNSAINLDDLGFEKKDTQQDADYQKTLNRRSSMLKTHQLLGLATGVAMAFTLGSANDSVGETGDAGKSARNRHAAMGITTGVLYFTTAAFAMLSPEAKSHKQNGRTKIHRALAFIHFPAMLATMYYGITDKRKLDRGESPSGHKATAANVAAASFYSALAVMVIPFGGDK